MASVARMVASPHAGGVSVTAFPSMQRTKLLSGFSVQMREPYGPLIAPRLAGSVCHPGAVQGAFRTDDGVVFVPSRRIADNREIAQRAILELQRYRGVYIHFRSKIVAPGKYFTHRKPGNPEDNVNQVAPRVIQLAAAGYRVFLPPGARRQSQPLLGLHCLNKLNLAEAPPPDLRSHVPEYGVVVALVGKRQYFTRLLGQPNQGAGMVAPANHRFLGQDVEAAIQRRPDLFVVKYVGTQHQHTIEVRGVEHAFQEVVGRRPSLPGQRLRKRFRDAFEGSASATTSTLPVARRRA